MHGKWAHTKLNCLFFPSAGRFRTVTTAAALELTLQMHSGFLETVTALSAPACQTGGNGGAGFP